MNSTIDKDIRSNHLLEIGTIEPTKFVISYLNFPDMRLWDVSKYCVTAKGPYEAVEKYLETPDKTQRITADVGRLLLWPGYEHIAQEHCSDLLKAFQALPEEPSSSVAQTFLLDNKEDIISFFLDKVPSKICAVQQLLFLTCKYFFGRKTKKKFEKNTYIYRSQRKLFIT